MKSVADVRRRLYNDFGYYADKALSIRTKDAKIAPLRLNEAQRRLVKVIEDQWAAEGRVRIVVLKARQMGLSTVIGGWGYFRTSQNSAQKSFVVAHKAESTQALFDMTKRFHDLAPEILRPATKYAGRRELSFPVLQSAYAVATAGGESIGRGETLTFVHASEVAFWPKSSAADNWNALMQAVPNSPGTAIFVESTANGVSGTFYDIWQGAVQGKNGFIPVFLPWFIQDEYRDPVPAGFRLTPDEKDLFARYGLDHEQLAFRRRKIAETSHDQFKQEYPTNADEAFLTTGMPVFNPTQLAKMAEDTARLPTTLYALNAAKTEFEENPRGMLAEWLPHDPAETYVIGADVAMGVPGGDWSVAQVLDSQKRQVAKFRGHVHPDFFADILNALGRRYNEARLIVESNNHGILPNTRLAKELAYPNIYLRETVDKLTDEVRLEPGFDTNAKTKPLIVDQLRAAMRLGEVTIFCKNTLREMQTYTVNESGKMEAEGGSHDDEVMSLALANHIHEGKFVPCAMPDDAYIEMI